MNSIKGALSSIKNSISKNVQLVAVSKTKPWALIQEAYDSGQRHFGENKAQEILEKAPILPEDVKWHFIGHLQRKKVKQIIPFTHLIHSVDSLRLLEEINKRAAETNKVQDILIQARIANEETKFGIKTAEVVEFIKNSFGTYENIRIVGLMGMASFTDDEQMIRNEFNSLKLEFDKLKSDQFKNLDYFNVLSMGMSGDYAIAIEEGSTMIRVGSKIFGNRY